MTYSTFTPIVGAKKGSGQPRKPNIAPDSAQSKTRIKLMYGLSEGEILGLVDGAKSIYLEDTPLHAENGSVNFENVKWQVRHGTNDQEYISGFEDISSEMAVGVELKQSRAWVKSFTNLELDAILVRMRFSALRTTNPDNGDVTGATVEYAIDVMTDGTAWVQYGTYKVSDKTSANYERSHRIDLPKAEQGWQIRVRRLTPDSNSDYLSDKSFIQAYTEVIDAKLAYPNTALLALEYDAETFSNVAKMSAECYGVKIKVPSNYDPISRTYSGIWDGTFKIEYTNNPAWHFYDACINQRYALGDKIDSSMIDKWSIYRLGQYCDEMVSDGKGGKEPRFTLNVYEQSQDDAWSVLSKMAGAFRAYIYWDGQAIVCDADMPQDTYFTYTSANVIDGHFERSGTASYARHTVAKVAWNNPQNQYKTEYVMVRDEEAISKFGNKVVDIQAYGCTSESQAQRAGLWALKSEQLETQTITFKVGLDGYIPQPGKIIEVADPIFAGRANGGRVSSINSKKDQITLDRDNIICRAGDRLVINSNHGKAEARIIKHIQGRVVTVVAPFDNIAPEHIWVIDAQDLATMKYRVISITQDETHQFTITGLEYNPKKYDAIDYGTVVDNRPITLINPALQAPVERVEISATHMVQQGLNIATMVIAFPQVQGAVKYLVEWKKDDGNWIKLPVTGTNSVEVQGIYDGKYQARVTAISAFDMASLATYSVVTRLQGKAGKPPKLAKITATGTLFGMKLDWAFNAKSEDTAYTEIQVSPNGRANIATLGQFAYPTNKHEITGLQGSLTQFYRAKIVDKLGNESDWTDWVSGTTSANPQAVLDILEGQINETTLNSVLTGKINTAITTSVANTNAINKEIRDRATAIQAETTARTQAIQTETTARNNAIRAETTARTQAIQAESTARTTAINAKATEIRNALTTQITTLQNGLTQEIQNRKDADNSTVSALNAYKVSNDNAVATVLQKAETAISVNNAQTTQINALQSNLTTVQNGLATKLDSSAISNYYTKAQTDNKIQQVATGKIDEFKSSLIIGGENILRGTSEMKLGSGIWGTATFRQSGAGRLESIDVPDSPVQHLSKGLKITPNSTAEFGLGFAQDRYKLDLGFYTYSFWVNGTAGDKLKIQPFWANENQNIPYIYVTLKGGWEYFTFTGENKVGNIEQSIGYIYYITKHVGNSVVIIAPMLEKATIASDWQPSQFDINHIMNVNAQAINTINSNVSNLNSTLTSQSQQLTQLRNDLTATNVNVSTKADTTALNTLDSRVTQTNDRITAESQKITALQNSLNAVNGTLNSKADSSALSNLNTTVQNINGVVTTQANQITQLESGLNTVNQTLNNKVNASALRDYYTKAEVDNVTAGKIETFGSSLGNLSENTFNSQTSLSTYFSGRNYRDVNLATNGFVIDNPNNKLSVTRIECVITGNDYWTISFIARSDSLKKFKIDICDLGAKEFNVDSSWNYYTSTVKVTNHSAIHHFVDFDLEQNGILYVKNVMINSGKVARLFSEAENKLQNQTNANAQAINTINSNVSNLNNTVTSQGQAITQLNNSLNATNTNVSKKADSTALNTLNNRVTQTNDRITTESQKITALQNSLNTVNGTLNTKADSSALSTLDNRVTQQGNNITSQSNQITNLITRLDENNLCLNPSMKENNSGWSGTALRTLLNNEYVIELTNRDAYYISPYVSTANVGDKFFFRAKLKVKDSTHRMRVGLSGNYISNNGAFWLLSFVKSPSEASDWIDVSGYLTVPSNLKNVKLWCGNEKPANTSGNWYIKDVVFQRVDNILNALIDAKADSSALNNLVTNVTRNTEGITSQGSKITQLENSLNTVNQNLNTKASSTALSTLDSKVTTLNNTVNSQGQSITQLNNSLNATNINISKKADATALTALDNRVTQQGNNITSQGSKITQLENSLNTVNQNLNSKANASALTTLDSKVSSIDGKVNTHANQITTLNTTLNSQTTTINQQTQTINGISAVRAITVDNNGVISGYGLMSELKDGRVTSQFGVNADTFYIGSPSSGQKPFIFNASPRVIDGVSYPAGAWINSTFIANATIQMAHIQDSIQSDNFVSGRSGWRLYKDGRLELNGTADDGTRLELSHRGLVVYYANGQPAIELGIKGIFK